MKSAELAIFLILILLASVAWLGAAGLYWTGFRVFGPRRHRAVPWTISEVTLIAPLVAGGVWRGLMTHEEAEHSVGLALLSQLALVSVVSLPFLVLFVRGGRAYQMGLHASHWGRNVVAGLGSYLLAAPLVAITNLLALQFYHRNPHSIELAIRESPTISNILLSSLGAVVLFPFVEELVFRGILQPWLRKQLGTGNSILLCSGIFAIAHADAWPAPLALFVLALFLGYLAERSTSLVGPVVLHATFNGTNMAVLVIAILTNSLPD